MASTHTAKAAALRSVMKNPVLANEVFSGMSSAPGSSSGKRAASILKGIGRTAGVPQMSVAPNMSVQSPVYGPPAPAQPSTVSLETQNPLDLNAPKSFAPSLDGFKPIGKGPVEGPTQPAYGPPAPHRAMQWTPGGYKITSAGGWLDANMNTEPGDNSDPHKSRGAKFLGGAASAVPRAVGAASMFMADKVYAPIDEGVQAVGSKVLNFFPNAWDYMWGDPTAPKNFRSPNYTPLNDSLGLNKKPDSLLHYPTGYGKNHPVTAKDVEEQRNGVHTGAEADAAHTNAVNSGMDANDAIQHTKDNTGLAPSPAAAEAASPGTGAGTSAAKAQTNSQIYAMEQKALKGDSADLQSYYAFLDPAHQASYKSTYDAVMSGDATASVNPQETADALKTPLSILDDLPITEGDPAGFRKLARDRLNIDALEADAVNRRDAHANASDTFTAYIRAHDTYLGRLDGMLADFDDKQSSGALTGMLGRTSQNYRNYLVSLRGDQQARYSTLLKDSIDQENSDYDRFTTRYDALHQQVTDAGADRKQKLEELDKARSARITAAKNAADAAHQQTQDAGDMLKTFITAGMKAPASLYERAGLTKAEAATMGAGTTSGKPFVRAAYEDYFYESGSKPMEYRSSKGGVTTIKTAPGKLRAMSPVEIFRTPAAEKWGNPQDAATFYAEDAGRSVSAQVSRGSNPVSAVLPYVNAALDYDRVHPDARTPAEDAAEEYLASEINNGLADGVSSYFYKSAPTDTVQIDRETPLVNAASDIVNGKVKTKDALLKKYKDTDIEPSMLSELWDASVSLGNNGVAKMRDQGAPDPQKFYVPFGIETRDGGVQGWMASHNGINALKDLVATGVVLKVNQNL